MSRTRRTVDVSTPIDVWAEVDRWADEAVDTVAVRARWSGRATPAGGLDRFVDVADRDEAEAALSDAGLRLRPVRPERRALGRTGDVALRLDDDVLGALADAGVAHRVVSRARRYRWLGPVTGPVLCEISSSGPADPVVIEAWHEPAWTDSLRPRLTGQSDEERRRPPTRVLQARASINRLLEALGVDPIQPG